MLDRRDLLGAFAAYALLAEPDLGDGTLRAPLLGFEESARRYTSSG
jgi:hypothetical protein